MDGNFAYNPSTGTVSATVFKGNIDAVDGDFDGTLEADAITIGGTAVGSIFSPIAGGTGILTTGALDAGSITSNFGTINNGASAITTTGVGSFGSLDISGDIDVDGTTNLDVVDIDGAVNMATTALVTGVLTTTAATVFNGGFASNANSSFSSSLTHAVNAGVARFNNSSTGQPVAIYLEAIADNGGAGNKGAIYFDAGADGSVANNSLSFNADHQSNVTPDMTITPSGVSIAGTALVTGVLTTTAVPLFNGGIDLPNINTWIKGGGHNVVQVDGTKTYLYGGTGGIQVRTADNASALVDITNAGNVGIGKVPTQKFEVEGGRSIFTDSSNFYSLGVKFKAANYPMYIGATDSLLTPSLQFSAATGAPLMSLTYGGNVGIGTTSPTGKLDIVGGSTYQPHLRITNNPGGGRTYGINVGVAALSNGYFSIKDETADAYRMVIDSSGNVGIGTTTPGTALHVVRTASGHVLRVVNLTDAAVTYGIKTILGNSGANLNNTSSAHFHGNTNGVGNWYLYTNGTTSFSSDERLKKNIEATRDGYLEDLCNLRIVKYNWKSSEDGDAKELGLIAQEVETVFPNLVQDDLNTISDNDDTIYKQLKQSVLPFMLLKAIQELSAKNDAQQTLIESMEARITALEGA